MTVSKSYVERHFREMTTPLNAIQLPELIDLLWKYHDLLSTKPGTSEIEGYFVKFTPDWSGSLNRR